MAKFLLTLFGGVSIIIGGFSFGFGFLSGPNYILMGWGSGMLLAGAPLLGFANVIELLERIAINTQKTGTPVAANPQTGQRIDPAVTKFFEQTGRSTPKTR
ncbi:hypothetical protein [Methylorubrum populi]